MHPFIRLDVSHDPNFKASAGVEVTTSPGVAKSQIRLDTDNGILEIQMSPKQLAILTEVLRSAWELAARKPCLYLDPN